MMTTREEDPRVCAQCAWYHPFPRYVRRHAGYCAHPDMPKDVSMRLWVHDDRQVACKYRIPIEELTDEELGLGRGDAS